MFTGLIEATGSVLSLIQGDGAARITIAAPTLAAKLRTGDSIAVSGVCLTALDIQTTPPQFSADLAAETIARTSLARLAPGHLVNLELPTPAGTPLGGHIVQGHVDATGTLLSLTPLHPASPATTDWLLTLTLPEALSPYVVEKGSITVEGISLTVASVSKGEVTIAIIPHTYAVTNLHTLAPGSELNLEADILAKYVERRRAGSASELTEAQLIANGY